MQTAKDLLTGEVFERKRINQNFLCPENRIKYHNQKANFIRQSLAYINKPLQKNYRVLCELMAFKEVAVYNKYFLEGRGMHFGVVTHHTRYEGIVCKAIYDFIIIPLAENDEIKIIKTKRDE